MQGVAAILRSAGAQPFRADGRTHVDLGTHGQWTAVLSGMVNVFAAGRHADGTVGRRIYLGTVTPGGALPPLDETLAGVEATIVAIPDGPAELIQGPVQGGDVAVLDGAALTFARVMLPAGARSSQGGLREALDALRTHVRALLAEDRDAIAAGIRGRSGQLGHAAARYRRLLATIFAGQTELYNIDPSVDPLLRACRHAAAAVGVPLTRIPRRLEPDPQREPQDAFAHLARIGSRRLVLQPRWWRQEIGPLLGFLADGHVPVVLLPRAHGGYEAHVYVEGRTPRPVPVDDAFAARLERTATIFYASLPDTARGLRGLAAFLLEGSRRDLLLGVAVSVVAGILGLAIPAATGLLVSRILPAGDLRMLVFLGVVLASTIAAIATCGYVSRMLLVRVEARAGTRGSAAILHRALELPLGFFRRFAVGDLADRLTSIDQIQLVVARTAVAAALGGAFMVAYLLLMLAMDPGVASITLGMLLASLALAFVAARIQSRHTTDALERCGRLDGFTIQVLDGIEKVRTAGAEEAALLQWLNRYRPARRSMYLAARWRSVLHVVGTAVPVAGAALLWWHFAHVSADHEGQVALFMAFNAAFGAATAATFELGYALGDLSVVLPTFRRLLPILEERPEVGPAADQPGTLEGAIVVQGVRHSFPGSAGETLRGISFEARPGDFVAIVGPSGSGKSTLVRVLLGLLRPSAGKVLYDGKDLAQLDVVSVRRQLGVVNQKARILPGSIFENIVGATLLTMDDAWAAAEQAGLADDIRAMPMQMHTFVNEQTLSGGQMQKLQLARALAGRPRILVLDEATSALDEVSQAHVAACLAGLMVTRIVVAHRLSTVRQADRILVVDRGAIVQSGTFDELAATDGAFRELVRRQSLDELPAVQGGAA
jgi:ATP-binding cassette subfamily C protein